MTFIKLNDLFAVCVTTSVFKKIINSFSDAIIFLSSISKLIFLNGPEISLRSPPVCTHPSLPAFVYQSLPAVMSPPPLLSVTVKERVPIIVTVNTTTDAGFAVTTPDLHVKDGLRPQPPPHQHGPSQTVHLTSNRAVCQHR